VSGPVTSVARVEDVQIFLKDPVQAGGPWVGDPRIIASCNFECFIA
jgi:hypothetical protein